MGVGDVGLDPHITFEPSVSGKRPARKGQLPERTQAKEQGRSRHLTLSSQKGTKKATPGGTAADHSPLELLPTPAHVLRFIPHQVKDSASHLLLEGPSSPTDTQPAGSSRRFD